MNYFVMHKQRTEEGKKVRHDMLKNKNGDHLTFNFTEKFIDRRPLSGTITTFTSDNMLFEIQEIHI